MAPPDADDPGLVTPAETSLLMDQYELAMAASYFRRDMNDVSVFELFVRRLPPRLASPTRRLALACAALPRRRFRPAGPQAPESPLREQA